MPGSNMPETTGSIRDLKEKLTALFSKGAPEEALTAICRMPLRKVVNALFPFFYSKDPLHFWQAITAMGAVVSLLAEENVESARVVMRRLMWNLNDESGGIGWGSAEAMGEIMARNDRMAEEYACILISYINPCGNFIDQPRFAKRHSLGTGEAGPGSAPPGSGRIRVSGSFFNFSESFPQRACGLDRQRPARQCDKALAHSPL